MAKRPTRRQRQPRNRSLMRRLTRGPTLMAAVIAGAIAVVVVIIVVSVVTQGGDGIGDLPEIEEGRILGDASAPVTILEFADYQCPHCGTFALTTGKQIEEEYIATGLVRLEFHNMAFVGDESVWAAMAAECANEQGEFWEYHDELFQKQRGENVGGFSLVRLKQFAGTLGLDQEAFDACLDSGKYTQAILDETDAGRAAGVSSTPTLFIMVTGSDDYELVKNQPFEDLQKIIDEKLEEAGAAAAATP